MRTPPPSSPASTWVEAGDGITAMRGIISEAGSNPLFLLLLIGSAVVAVVMGVIAAPRLGTRAARTCWPGVCTLSAGIVTMAFNAPLNKQLNAVDPVGLSVADAAREWQAYVGPWVVWNTVRCIAALVGAVFFAAGLLALARGREPAGIV